MNAEQMRTRAPNARVVGVGVLREHRLSFPLYSNDWGGGVASVQPLHGGTVWGVLYEVSDEDIAALDRYEGFRAAGDQHNLYDRVNMTVDVTRPDDGSVPRRVRAALYVARPSNPSPPSRRYLDTILAGAKHHKLPEEYVATLAGHPVLAES